MLHSMGMTKDVISDEMLELMKRAEEGKPLIYGEGTKIVERGDNGESSSLLKKHKKAVKISH